MMVAERTPTRPILRYHGGKWKIAQWVIEHLPPHRVYVEPYGGAGSVLFQKPRAAVEIYNDLDGEIVNVFREMRNRPQQLIRALQLTPFSRAEHELSFIAAACPIEQARRTIVRSYMSYGSTFTRRTTDGELMRTGFRAVRRDATTTAADWSGLPEAFVALAQRLQGVLIEDRKACELIPTHDGADTLFYVDPPYVHATRTAMVEKQHHGYRHEMSDADHRELAAVLHAVRGMVVLSGYPSELYDRELFAGWKRVDRPAWACNAKARTEALWFNDAAWSAIKEGSLFDA